MTLPLMYLALLTVVGGFLYMQFGNFITPNHTSYSINIDTKIAIISVSIALIGILLATYLYLKDNERPAQLAAKMQGLYKAAYNRFYIDNAYLFVTKKIIFNGISRPIAWFDRHVVDGAMNGMAWLTGWTSEKTKGLQSGSVQWYAWVFLFGTLLITAILVF
jgi:NADH-quinone oxidoreductase subunit L